MAKTPQRAKLPAKPTDAKVWVDEKGKLKILIAKNPFGGTGRFAKCVESVEARGGAMDARAVCAAAGRKKYGKKKFAAMAKAGKKRAARKNPVYVVKDGAGKILSAFRTKAEAQRMKSQWQAELREQGRRSAYDRLSVSKAPGKV